MKKRLIHSLCLGIVLAGSSTVHAATLTALSTFGGGDGWLSPTEAPGYLGGANVQRGMTYNSANNHLYVADRNGGTFVRVLDGDTGALLSSLDTTGISGGTFPINIIDVAGDGAIYVSNLAIGADFKVYRWANEAAVPTIAFSGASGQPRTGDTMAVRGSGTGTQIIASGSGSTGFKLFTTADGSSFTDAGTFGTSAPSGAYRLGLDFIDSSSALGKQTATSLYDADFSGGAANTNNVNSANEAPLAFDQANKLLATVDFATSDVRLYDASDLSLLTSSGFMDLANNTTSFVTNGNGVGDLKFGTGPSGDLRLYALNTNNGIQAFQIVVPEPATFLLFGFSAVGLLINRRRG